METFLFIMNATMEIIRATTAAVKTATPNVFMNAQAAMRKLLLLWPLMTRQLEVNLRLPVMRYVPTQGILMEVRNATMEMLLATTGVLLLARLRSGTNAWAHQKLSQE